MKTNWEVMRDYINSYQIGSTITRKDLMSSVKIRSSWTVDIYRKILTNIGVLELEKKGQYKVKQKIPNNLTTSMATKLNQEFPHWKQWFIPLEEKIKILKKK